MCIFHNVYIRWLNSIYIQGPNIPDSEKVNFVNYAIAFTTELDLHHRLEETVLFPSIERETKIPGLMATEVEQHKAFHDGLEQYTAYLNGLKGKELEFDAAKLNTIIDSFAPTMVEHLTHEVTHLSQLPTQINEAGHVKAEDVDFTKLFQNFDERAQKEAAPFTASCGIVCNLDMGFEDKRWASIPAIPWFPNFLFRRVFPLAHPGWYVSTFRLS
jgi:hypothetical protein